MILSILLATATATATPRPTATPVPGHSICNPACDQYQVMYEYNGTFE